MTASSDATSALTFHLPQAFTFPNGDKTNMTARSLLSHAGLVFGRSFCPLSAIVIIVGAVLWGPWVSLAITVLALSAAMRFS